MLPDAVLRILQIDADEVLEVHIQVGLLHLEEAPNPLLSCLLGFKASFRRFATVTLPIGIAVLHIPLLCLGVLLCSHA